MIIKKNLPVPLLTINDMKKKIETKVQLLLKTLDD